VDINQGGESGYADGGGIEKLANALSPRALPLRKRLEETRKQHLDQIVKLDELIALLDANPAIERFQDLTNRIMF